MALNSRQRSVAHLNNPSSRLHLPRSEHRSHVELSLGHSLVEFAIKATVSLRNECTCLAEELNPSPFFSILSTHLYNVEARLARRDSLLESRVLRLLLALERLARFPTPLSRLVSPSKQESYPHLILILKGDIKSAQDSIRQLARDLSKKEDRRRFEDTFKAFSGTNSKLGTLKLSDFTKTNAQPRLIDHTTQCLQKLYSSLSQLCHCVNAADGGGFQANVALNSMKPPVKSDDGLAVSTFILHRSPESDVPTEEWKETCIRVILEQSDSDKDRTPSKAHFAPPGEKIVEFCKLVRSTDLGCLQLSTTNAGVFHSSTERSQSKISLQSPSISLARVLESSNLKRHTTRKAVLSLLITRAICRFYESDWVAEDWTKHTVQFMRQKMGVVNNGVRLDHQPFISTEFRASDETTSLGACRDRTLPEHKSSDKRAGQTHVFPTILALGIILLEIEMEKSLEVLGLDKLVDESGKARINAKHIAAGEFIESEEWTTRSPFDVLPAVKQVIEICIKPDTGVLGTDPTQIKKKLFDEIVRPLEGLVQGLVGESWESLDPGPITFKPSEEILYNSNDTRWPAKLQVGGELTPPMRLRPSSCSVEQDMGQYPGFSGLSSTKTATCSIMQSDTTRLAKTDFASGRRHAAIPRPVTQAVTQPYVRLKGDSKPEFLAAHSNVIDSSSWLEKFDHAGKHLSPVVKGERLAAVKIAILDTGCDIEDQFFAGPGIDYVDDLSYRWLDLVGDAFEPEDVDPMKHGTGMTALLLRLVPGALVYVVRVALDSTGLPAAEDAIVKAITQAVAKWDIDIFSMSFGFGHRVERIRDAILEAEKMKKDKILFFAAANNDGLNDLEMFPAFLENVISARGTHFPGGFLQLYDPSTRLREAGPQYGTLALEVPCVWPDNRLTKSGCSVATPIMASIAALIIYFVKRKFPYDHRNHDLIQTRLGMLAVFRAMTAGQKGDRLYLAPWQLFEGERDPFHLVAAALADLP